MGYQPMCSDTTRPTPPNPYAGAERIVTVGKYESTCPNCGAPIKGKICSYCRTGFRRDTDQSASSSAVVISQAVPGYHSVADSTSCTDREATINWLRASTSDLIVLE